MINYNTIIGTNQKEDYYLKFEDRLKNSICIGSLASGKYSQLIKPMINQDILNKNISVILFDSDNNISKDVYNLCKFHDKEVVVFDPTVINNTIKFNPLKGNNEICKKVLLDGLKTECELNNTDFDFEFYNKLIENSIYILKEVYGENSNLLDLYYLISNQSNNGSKIITTFLKNNISIDNLNTGIEIANWFTNSYYIDLKEYSKSILLRAKLEKLLTNKFSKNALVLDRDCNDIVDLESIIKGKQSLLINTNKEEFDIFTTNMLFSYIATTLNQSSFLNKEDNVALYLQEPQNLLLGNIHLILKEETTANLATMIMIENIEDLDLSSRDTSIKNYTLNNCLNNFVFPTVSKETAKYYLSLLGDNQYKEIECINNIRFMKFGEMLFIQNKENTYCKKLRIKYIDRFLDDYLKEHYNDYIY